MSWLMNDGETRLVRMARRGDRAALASIVKTREQDLCTSAYAILRSGWDAQDAVQEALLEVCAKIQTLKDPAKFDAWLARILVRKCYDRLRGQSVECCADEVGEGEAQVVDGSLCDEAVLHAIAALPEPQRLAVVMRFLLDLSYIDMERVTGWPLGTVKSRVNRGLANLRESLVEWRLDDAL